MDFTGGAAEPDDPRLRSFDESLVMTRRDPPSSTLRSMAKQFLAVPSVLALWQARRAEPQLSADGILARRKERFGEVLAGIRRDYF
jgi:succinoglycan biosynthesis protein ExoV